MTSEFDQALIDTAANFVDTFGESVTYWPKAGGSRAITAVVTRGLPETIEGAPYGHAPKTTIQVVNSNTTGIRSDEINLQGDKIEYQIRIGETAQKRRITNIISNDHGMMELEIN